MKKARLIFSTTSSAGGNLLRDACLNNISYLIIDEACQSTEPTCLMPFMWKPKKVILVGDHKQLRATILQTKVGATQFDQSLFERLAYSEDTTRKVKVVKPGIIVRRLIYQYRMHSSIREFPSWRWYEN